MFINFGGNLIVLLAKKREEKVHKLMFMWDNWWNWQKCQIGNESSNSVSNREVKIFQCK